MSFWESSSPLAVCCICLLTPLGHAVGRFCEKRWAEKRQKEQKKTEARRAAWFKGLPPSVNNQTQDLRNVSMQRQSSFFDKLPPELRREIYAYALGGERLLVEVAEHHERSDYFRIKCAAGQRLLAFPRSCKIAYVEATEFIYTSNTFLFDGVVACLCFQRIVPKDFFRSLQSIHLRYDRKNKDRVTFMEEDVPPYDLSSWNYTWLGIAKVEALRYLRVDCVLGPRGHGFYHEEFLLTPLKALHSVEKIEVFTDWSGRDSLNTESWSFSVSMGVEDL